MAEQVNSSPRGKEDFLSTLKRVLIELGAKELADSIEEFSHIRIPNTPAAAKDALDYLLRRAFAEITAETNDGIQTFVCCSDYEFVKRFSGEKKVRPAKQLGPASKDPFKTKSKTMVLTWDLLNNKMISIKTEKRWEITGIPITIPKEISQEYAEILRKILTELYTAKRKQHGRKLSIGI